jgi:glycosyltransferase involved in cell wall biosynthesis
MRVRLNECWTTLHEVTHHEVDFRNFAPHLGDVNGYNMIEPPREYRVLLDRRSSHAPLVTVVVVSFNQSRYLHSTLDSIAAQDCTDFEIVLIDDASQDDSTEVAFTWAQTHSLPIIIVQNTYNRGLVPTLAVATSLVRTPLFSMIAGDDLLEPRKLSIQIPLLLEAQPTVGYVYSDAHLISEDGAPVGETWLQFFGPGVQPKEGALFEAFLLEEFHVPVMTYLIRTDVLRRSGAFGPGLAYEDTDLNLRLSYQAHARFSDYPSARYRLRPNGLHNTLSPAALHRSDFRALRPWLRYPRTTRRRARRKYAIEAYWLYEHHEIGAQQFLSAIRDAPSVETVVLAFLALFHVPMQSLDSGRARLLRLTRLSRTMCEDRSRGLP